MQHSKKLIHALRALLALVEDEASKNLDFAQRLESIVSTLPSGTKKEPKIRPSQKIVVPDVAVALEEKGESEFRFWMRDFDIPTLKAIVKTNGFDPGKASQRWSEPDKFISLIVEQAAARLKRGSSFLTPKIADTTLDDSNPQLPLAPTSMTESRNDNSKREST